MAGRAFADKMEINDKLAREIVSAHADALRHGYDVTDVLAGRYPQIAPLLRIAQDVNAALVLLPVPLAFRAALHADLLRARPARDDAPAHAANAGPGWVIGSVAVGSAVTGLAVYLLRRMSAQGRPAAA